MIDVDRSPTRPSAGLALGCGAAVVVLAGTGSTLGGAMGGLAWLAVLFGFVGRSRTWVSAGAGGLWLATLLGSTGGLPLEGTLLAFGLGIVAWDAGRRAIDLGERLTRNASTWRAELLHGATTTLLAGGGMVAAYGLFAIAPARPSVAAVTLLSLTALLAVGALRTS